MKSRVYNFKRRVMGRRAALEEIIEAARIMLGREGMLGEGEVTRV